MRGLAIRTAAILALLHGGMAGEPARAQTAPNSLTVTLAPFGYAICAMKAPR